MRLGHWNRWDLQLGRFESWEVMHLGMGLDVNTLERKGAEDFRFTEAVTPYLVRFPFETRPSGPGYAALHLYPTGFLRFELLGIAGPDANGMNSLGTRPGLIVDLGMLKLKVAAEYIKSRQRDEYKDANGVIGPSPNRRLERGVGGGLIFILIPASRPASMLRTAARRNRSASGRSGPDVRHPDRRRLCQRPDHRRLDCRRRPRVHAPGGRGFRRHAKAGYFDQLQGFGALQYVVAKRLFIKGVLGYARATYAAGGSTVDLLNTMYSGRVRSRVPVLGASPVRRAIPRTRFPTGGACIFASMRAHRNGWGALVTAVAVATGVATGARRHHGG